MTDVLDPRILRRFDICQKVGQGAYGVVWKAVHRKKGHTVALKKCFEAFRCNVDAQRTFREVMYLKALAGHENIISIQSVLRASNDRDLYITFEYMETDLSQVIKARILEPVHIQFITYQLLKALKYIHSAKLLHRDIKPSNILIDSGCSIKLCDFGLCRSVNELNNGTGPKPVLTDYVATRWYRAPEILLGATNYTKAVDTWAVGCILGEMFNGRAIFPGTSTMNQLERIIEVVNPSEQDKASIDSPFAKTMLTSVPNPRPRPLEAMFPNAPPEGLDLIRKCLQFNPANRITMDEAVQHPYLAQFHNAANEPIASRPVQIMIDDNKKYAAADYRERLYREIAKKKKEARRRRANSNAQQPGTVA